MDKNTQLAVRTFNTLADSKEPLFSTWQGFLGFNEYLDAYDRAMNRLAVAVAARFDMNRDQLRHALEEDSYQQDLHQENAHMKANPEGHQPRCREYWDRGLECPCEEYAHHAQSHPNGELT